ncbi:hypothetical protein [Cohnella rhizosphaerae]|uniref:Uncharacterized protein n=1 Tax=Cohnella rhizosphaerae TaxID=1457232 RepID=A0A9X4KWQ7_9BACL|nr:hypothetical protein [Cohnella rhizosphaerae]MDG0811928.1 hypothetical protein [Cohnella rhizosphaerae]
MLIGFTDRTSTRWPEAKAKEMGGGLLLYGLAIAALAAGAAFWGPLTIVAGAAAFILHEALLFWGRLRERGRHPVYVQDGRGVVILAVLPGTPAFEMGLIAGGNGEQGERCPGAQQGGASRCASAAAGVHEARGA